MKLPVTLPVALTTPAVKMLPPATLPEALASPVPVSTVNLAVALKYGENIISEFDF